MCCRAPTLVSTALLALQCCRVLSLSILGVGCSPSPCTLVRCAARGLSMPVSTALLALQCCFVCSHCLLSASAVLRRHVPSLDALPGFYAGFNCASRVAVLLCVQPLSTVSVRWSPSPCAPSLDALQTSTLASTALLALQCCLCAATVYYRRLLFSVAVCALARCAARLLCWLQLRFSRCSAACVQPLSTIGACCSPSPCAPSLDAPPGFYAGFNCASRVQCCLCAATVYYRRLLFSVAVCALARCAARLLC
jgi:hypothetical protein